MKKIVIASDSFKGSLSSMQVAEACKAGIMSATQGGECPEIVCVNVADGGEGTVEAVVEAMDGQMVQVTVSDPLGRPVQASYGLMGETAVIEMAAASGLPLLSASERNPELTSTRGTGELIADAIGRGARHFLIGIGGSATNDAGTGMLDALGYRFLDKAGAALRPCGGMLSRISAIDCSLALPALEACTFTVACDVDTPFCGAEGAAYVFAPQKGADKDMVERLDAGLEHFADVAEKVCGRTFRPIPGTGAAGGLGGAFLSMLEARLVRGIEMVLDAIGFDSLIGGADLVITGEGCMDSQTPLGKTAAGVLARAKAQGIPVIAICGCLKDCPELRSMGFCSIAQATPPSMALAEAMDPDTAKANVSATICKEIITFENNATKQ